MAKKTIYKRDNRVFEVITLNCTCFRNLMAETYVSEVIRPNWKIFRTRYIDAKTFLVDDYETIAEGEIAMLDKILQKEKEDKKRNQKWQEFNK